MSSSYQQHQQELGGGATSGNNRYPNATNTTSTTTNTSSSYASQYYSPPRTHHFDVRDVRGGGAGVGGRNSSNNQNTYAGGGESDLRAPSVASTNHPAAPSPLSAMDVNTTNTTRYHNSQQFSQQRTHASAADAYNANDFSTNTAAHLNKTHHVPQKSNASQHYNPNANTSLYSNASRGGEGWGKGGGGEGVDSPATVAAKKALAGGSKNEENAITQRSLFSNNNYTNSVSQNAPPPLSSSITATSRNVPPLSPERASLALDIEGLANGIQKRDATITALTEEMHLIRVDYQHNYSLLQTQSAELEALRKLLAVKEDEMNALEGKCAAQAQKIDGNEEDLQRYTAALHAKIEALGAQLSIMTTERMNAERQANDKEMELAGLRREMQTLQAKHARSVQTARQEALLEAEQQLLQREREVQGREEALHRQVLMHEHTLLQLNGEKDRRRDEHRSLQLAAEEAHRTIATKDATIEQLQLQLSEAKRQMTSMRNHFEAEALAMANTKDTHDKSITSTHHLLRRELEKKVSDLDALDTKLANAKAQHEADARRWLEEKSAQIELFESKYRAMSDKATAAEAKALSTSDELARTRRLLADAKARVAELEATNAHLVERNDECEHRYSLKEQELHRVINTSRRLREDLVDVSKTKEFLLTEADRRDWTSRSRLEVSQRLQSAKWRSDTTPSMLTDDASAVGNNSNNTTVFISGSGEVGGEGVGEGASFARHQQPRGNAAPPLPPPPLAHDTTAVQMLKDIKDMLGQSNGEIASASAHTTRTSQQPPSAVPSRNHSRANSASDMRRSSGRDRNQRAASKSSRRSRSRQGRSGGDDSSDSHSSYSSDEYSDGDDERSSSKFTNAKLAEELRLLRRERSREKLESERQLLALQLASEKSRRNIEQLKAANSTLVDEMKGRRGGDGEGRGEGDGGRGGQHDASDAQQGLNESSSYTNAFNSTNANNNLSTASSTTGRSVGFNLHQHDGAAAAAGNARAPIPLRGGTETPNTTINLSSVRGGDGGGGVSQFINAYQSHTNHNNTSYLPNRGTHPHPFGSQRMPPEQYSHVDETLLRQHTAHANNNSISDNAYNTTAGPRPLRAQGMAAALTTYTNETASSALKSNRIGDERRAAALAEVYALKKAHEREVSMMDISNGSIGGGEGASFTTGGHHLFGLQQQDHHNASKRNKRRPFAV